MTKYNLEEFKEWLEADPNRKAGLDWEEPNEENDPHGAYRETGGGFLVAQRRAFLIYLGGGMFQPLALGAITSREIEPYFVVFNQWKAEINQEKELKEIREKISRLEKNLATLTEKTEHQKQRILALEADKQDLIQQLSQQKAKWTNHLNQVKQQSKQEIILIKEVLNG